MAGCNSGNVGQGDLLASANCQANCHWFKCHGSRRVCHSNHHRQHRIRPRGEGFGHWKHRYWFRTLRNRPLRHGIGIMAGASSAVAGATTVGAWSGAGGAGTFSTALGAGTDELHQRARNGGLQCRYRRRG